MNREVVENILQATKSYTRGKVISVFGCGGDRDSGKRPIMGEISGRIADFTIITSDNPRTHHREKQQTKQRNKRKEKKKWQTS